MNAKTAEKSKRNVKRDIIVVVVLAVLALGAFAVSQIVGAQQNHSSAVAVVHASDDSETTLPLDTPTSVTITTDLGSNVVVVEDGQVYVSQSNCPNHDCITQGRIDSSSQQIVCLPHKMWIEIISSDQGQFATQSK